MIDIERNVDLAREQGSPASRIREQLKTGAEAVRQEMSAAGIAISGHVRAAGERVYNEASSAVGQKMTDARFKAADRLSDAARKVDSARLAGKMENTAAYLKDHSPSEAAAILRRHASAHPGRWICAALSIGVVTGLILGSGRKSRT